MADSLHIENAYYLDAHRCVLLSTTLLLSVLFIGQTVVDALRVIHSFPKAWWQNRVMKYSFLDKRLHNLTLQPVPLPLLPQCRWKWTMECHTTYTKKQLIECVKLMTGFHQNDVRNL
ncbi:hypothetical protein SUGI_0548390 [Cryptomeria japonica]|nr:hypothetical protein SUGI_0548390 [Cryptomeria japonica]